MAAAISAFGDLPWYFQNNDWLSKISCQMGTLNSFPINSYLQTVTSLGNSPILQDVNRLAALYNTPVNQSIQKILGLIGKLDLPRTPPPQRWDIPSMMFDYGQNIPQYMAALNNPLYNIWSERPAANKILLADREEKLAHFAVLAEEVGGESLQEPSTPTEEDCQAAAEEVKAILASGGNWEQRFMDSIRSFSKTHPVVAWILEKVFLVILLEVIINLSSSGIGQLVRPARLYEEPSALSPVIYQIEPEQSVIVVGDVPYYYAAQIKDPQTGEIVSGYVSKRSVRLYEGDSFVSSEPEFPEDRARNSHK